ncbi:hypothetical protein [Azotobacter vinelandii]|uniref:hypothetical protein n=1 Tax=Azotobacter vinelandii TaxID=354 RepID=UPI000773CA91|nr:hypothetical protein [Azotobacter vinelandii]
MNEKLWKALGIIRSKANLEWVSPSPFLPVFNFYEIHESGAIHARPEEIISAVSALNMRDDRVADALLSIRELPSKILKKFGKRPQQQETAPFGFNTFTLLQRTNYEISLGLAGRFWRPDLDICHIPSAREFEALDDLRVAKLVLRFQVIEHQHNIHTLRTETFVYCGNTRTKMLFTPYWLAIRFASGWIRRRTLASIQWQLSTGAR